ncbi:hypothetical protein PLICRDRAFT_176940 [Plicaturopsis crispa FD-325 SS-3]|nr:hypothetical protein PLICRDRAFT_176940 [Plicaturopsis crispa FD-325 SS-3]
MANIQLLSSDNELHTVDRNIIQRSALVKKIIDGSYDGKPIPVANVSSAILIKVIEYCEYHKNEPIASEDSDLNPYEMRNRTLQISPWDREFIDVDLDTLFDIIIAANYLEIRELIDVGSKRIASIIKGKTPDEIRKQFGIVNDFTPAEEEQIQKENRWAMNW